MLHNRKFFCSLLVLAMLFAVIMSGGCVEDNNIFGNVTNNNGNRKIEFVLDNPSNNNDNNNGGGNNSPSTPANINGTWIIEAGWENSCVSIPHPPTLTAYAARDRVRLLLLKGNDIVNNIIYYSSVLMCC